MPYIKKYDQENIRLGSRLPQTSGELNYAITEMIQGYLLRKGVNYETMNAISGVLHRVDDEFSRRVVHPYEDKKIAENGDVYRIKEILGEK